MLLLLSLMKKRLYVACLWDKPPHKLLCTVSRVDCFWLFSVLFYSGITSLLDAKEVGVKIFEDYASSWFWILMYVYPHFLTNATDWYGVADLWFMGVFSGLVISMLVSLIFILLLRFTAGVLFWMVIFGVIVAVGYGWWWLQNTTD